MRKLVDVMRASASNKKKIAKNVCHHVKDILKNCMLRTTMYAYWRIGDINCHLIVCRL